MARIDTRSKVLSVDDVLIFLHPDSREETVKNTFRKYLKGCNKLPRVHKLLHTEGSSGQSHSHTFAHNTATNRPKPTLVLTSYAELHEFFEEYNSRNPKSADRITVFLESNREALEAIWGAEPEVSFAAKVFPSQVHHVNLAFKHFDIVPTQGSTTGTWTVVIHADLLPDLVEKIGFYTDVAFVRKSFNRQGEQNTYQYFRCYRRHHAKQGELGDEVKVENSGVPHPSVSTSETTTPGASSSTTCPSPPDPSEGTPSRSKVLPHHQRSKQTRRYTHTCTTGCRAHISARLLKCNTKEVGAPDVKGKCTIEDSIKASEVKAKAVSNGEMLEVNLDLRHVGHDPDDVYEVSNLPLHPRVRNQFLSMAQVGVVGPFVYTMNDKE